MTSYSNFKDRASECNEDISELSQRIIRAIASVPEGRVASYGAIARLAGNPNASRQVTRILHSSSQKYRLPWHRIVGKGGVIRLASSAGREEQIALLESEGVRVLNDTVDMLQYGIDEIA